MGIKLRISKQRHMKLRIGGANPYFAPKDSEIGFYVFRMKLADIGEEYSLQRLLHRLIWERTRV